MKITRLDGMPLLPEHVADYKKENADAFDAVEDKVGRVTEKNVGKFRAALQAVEDRCKEKYPCVGDIPFPDTPEKIRELTEKYNSVICFQVDADTDEVYILLSPVTGPGA